MDIEGVRKQFEGALPHVARLLESDPKAYFTLSVGRDGATVNFFPSDGFKEEATRKTLTAFGKLKKDANGNLSGEKDGVGITLFSVLKCEIVGYKKVRKPKVIETGDFIETEVPIYECRAPIGKEAIHAEAEQEPAV